MHILYGAPHSLYTAKVRCYLGKQGIAYRELLPSHPSYVNDIAPRIRRNIIPVILTPSGEIVQDTIDIIDHFEAQGVPLPAYPPTPLQQVLAIVIEYYGSQALLKHAMHYRWSYLDEQREFLEHAFSVGAPRDLAEKIMARMHSYLPQLGVSEQTIPLIEASYERLLANLNTHFAQHPYLFGARPTIADYGLIGPLYAHLGRDPVPAQLMKVRAPHVYRWAERMNAADLDSPEFPQADGELLVEDAIPVTLEALLMQIRDEIFPELTDKLAFLDEWIEKLSPHDGAAVSEKPHQRRIGVVATTFCGAPIETGVEPYLMYLLRRADRALSKASDLERRRVLDALAKYGLQPTLMGERKYSVSRRNHIEVWERASE